MHVSNRDSPRSLESRSDRRQLGPLTNLRHRIAASSAVFGEGWAVIGTECSTTARQAATFTIQAMIRLKIVPSPSPDVLLDHYDKAVIHEFDRGFDDPAASPLLRPFLMDPDEASAAVVLQNQCEKAITAIKYRWEIVDKSGKKSTRAFTSDSYSIEFFRAVAEPHARRLVSASNRVDSALIHHFASGGGGGGGAGRSGS
jgi:hypothetical protein